MGGTQGWYELKDESTRVRADLIAQHQGWLRRRHRARGDGGSARRIRTSRIEQSAGRGRASARRQTLGSIGFTRDAGSASYNWLF